MTSPFRLAYAWRLAQKFSVAIPRWQALGLLFFPCSKKARSVRLRRHGREIFLRPGTSDQDVLLKTFVFQELQIPYGLSPSPRVIVDAGANIGLSTLWFSLHHPQARIIAIEPEPENFRLLQRNLADRPRIEARQAALWNRRASLRLQNQEAEPWMVSVREGKAGGVPAVTMEELVRRHGRIDILKLDIEGAEKELFSPARTPWLNRIGLLIVELHDRIRPGCSCTFYRKLIGRPFHQEIRGESVFIRFLPR